MALHLQENVKLPTMTHAKNINARRLKGTSVPGASLFLQVLVLAMPLSTILCSPAARAWGAMGHEIAAQLADPYLTAHTRQQVEALLGKDTLKTASTWADRMRSDPAPFWQEEAGPYHYVTIPRGRQYADVGPPPQGDAASALTQFARDLRSPSVSLERKQLALRFAIHIIQDLQQPLHVGNGLDRGGNDVPVRIFGETSNLHSVWDRQMFESTARTQAQWLDYFKASELLRRPTQNDADPQVWIAESAKLRETLYPVPASIDTRYIRRELPRAEARLALAGIRTAAWLNAIYDDNATPGEDRPLEPAPEVAEKVRWWQRIFKN
ncbi:S1/P1 nuclease [gamma proteobacterium NOR5-3]|nr:S1/P1 nuclease [gamma proteobacterium NOR5-3]